MAEFNDSLFDESVWGRALEKFGIVTHLTVTLFNADGRRLLPSLPPTPLFDLLHEYGFQGGILDECANQCLRQRYSRPAVVVSPNYGLAVVGTSLMLDGKIVGAAVAGYALVDFCRSPAIASLAREASVPFRSLWTIARQIQPLPQSRLAIHGELLQVLGDTILQQQARAAQLRDVAIDLERRVEERTREVSAANISLERELRERQQAEQRVRRLLGRVTVAQEDERRRIGRDVHDNLGQQMIALKLKLEMLETQSPAKSGWLEGVQQAQAYLSQLDRDLVSFSRELRPLLLEEFGLSRALDNFVHEWSRHHGIPACYQDVGVNGRRLNAETEVHLFRLVQEALNNVFKHAHATRVDIDLEVLEKHLVLSIEDDGIGFDSSATTPATVGMGLTGMRERVEVIDGILSIVTAKDRGTTVRVSVPIPDEDLTTVDADN